MYSLVGCRGRSMQVYDDRVIIETKVTFGSIVAHNATDGEKTIYYVDCIGVQFKDPGFTIGYLQLETASSSMNNKGNDFFNENTFTFEENAKTSKIIMHEVANYIKGRIREYKKPQANVVAATPVSSADELKKFKELLDLGVISQDEFNAKKKQLLGL